MKDGIECSFTAEIIVLSSDKAVIALLRLVDERTTMLVDDASQRLVQHQARLVILRSNP